MPDNRYFIFGDLLANTLVGLLAALLSHGLIDVGWWMPIAMIVAMLLGMATALLLDLVLLLRFFGAMEVMLPTMLSGMTAGMWVGMRTAMAPLATLDAAAYGVLCGLLVIALCWTANSQLKGKRIDG